ncbi:MAG: LysM peptidoglycan-binding domain-containing protein [Anaerolineae bacterium]|nr:LysM peptidoglycan-binding domain-containing protein [Anaerolineae bacterium]
MNRKSISLLVLSLLLVISLFVAGCTRNAAPDVQEELPDVGTEEELMAEYAEQNTAAMATATAEAAGVEGTPEGATVEPTTEVGPTEESPTEVATEPPVVETTEVPVETATPVLIEISPTETPAPLPEAVLSTPSKHIVQSGENLFRIALRYNVSLDALSRANGITNPALIYVGQELTIPQTGSTTQPTPAPSPGTGGGIVHVVQSGENLFRVALKYNYNYLYLARYNGISNPNMVYVGQEIIIP